MGEEKGKTGKGTFLIGLRYITLPVLLPFLKQESNRIVALMIWSLSTQQ